MATGEVKISDGVDTVDFDPGATVKRMLDKDPGLFIMHRSRQSTPKVRDFKKAHDIIQVDTDFKDRFSDYQTLWSMIKEQTNDSTYTFTWGTETFTVAVKRLIAETVPGAGTMRAIHCEMEIVTA